MNIVKNLIYIIKNFKSSWKNKLQVFVSKELKSNGYAALSRKYIKTVGTEEYQVYLDDFSPVIEQVETEYCFDDLRSSDIILDIGANIGVFSLKVRNKVKSVYAVEPIFIDAIKKNIVLNNATNIEVFPLALGNGENILIEYGEAQNTVLSKSLSELIQMCGGTVDFLKCDCEGGEWCIKPVELKGIRRIEGELHNFNGENMNDFVDMLRSCGYNVNCEPRSKTTMLIHAFKN